VKDLIAVFGITRQVADDCAGDRSLGFQANHVAWFEDAGLGRNGSGDTRLFMTRHRGKQCCLVFTQRRQLGIAGAQYLRKTLDRVQIAKNVVVVKTGCWSMRPSVADRLRLLDPVAGCRR
jgi:hypothetical protein